MGPSMRDDDVDIPQSLFAHAADVKRNSQEGRSRLRGQGQGRGRNGSEFVIIYCRVEGRSGSEWPGMCNNYFRIEGSTSVS